MTHFLRAENLHFSWVLGSKGSWLSGTIHTCQYHGWIKMDHESSSNHSWIPLIHLACSKGSPVWKMIGSRSLTYLILYKYFNSLRDSVEICRRFLESSLGVSKRTQISHWCTCDTAPKKLMHLGSKSNHYHDHFRVSQLLNKNSKIAIWTCVSQLRFSWFLNTIQPFWPNCNISPS